MRLNASFALCLALLVATACGDSKPEPPKKDNKLATGTQPAPQPQAAPAAPAAPALPESKVAKMEFSENDFVESDKSRDPFRAYSGTMADTVKRPTINQKQVVLGDRAVDELRLVAIVMGGDYPRAMLIDPVGKGWVVRRGDYLGRPDLVHVGGASGADYQLNWRVDRVRDQDIVLLREDPAQPGIPPATKVIPLHPEGDAKDQKM